MSSWQEDYPTLHRALAPEYRDLSAEQVEAVVRGVFGDAVGLEDAEGFLDDVGRAFSGVARAAGPVVQRALPGVVSGAMGGAALGPWGMLGGAVLGGLGSALGGGGGAPQAPRPPVVAPHQPAGLMHPQLPSQPGMTGVGGLGGLGAGALAGAGGLPPAFAGAAGGSAGSIMQLLGALASPTVQQALGSMLMGGAGARTVATPGGNHVPVAAITNLLGMLAHRASAEWEALVPSAEAESLGEALDFAAPETRADWLLGQLAPAGEAWVREDWGESDEAWLDELYDELDASLAWAEDPVGEDVEALDESAFATWEPGAAWTS